MAERSLPHPKRSYVGTGKRKRPCDLCRLRKVFCHVEDGPPCLQCQKSEAECTFVVRSAKRQQVVSVGSPGASDLAVPFNRDTVASSPNIIPVGAANGEATDVVGEQQQSSVSQSSELLTLQPGTEGLQEQERATMADQDDPNALFDFNMMEFDSLSYIGLNASPQDVSFEQMYRLPNQQLGSAPRHPPPARHAAISEAGDLPLVNSIDGKENVHGVYFGLSGETDPYLLRNYKYDENGEFRMFKLVYRQVANDVYNIIPRERSTHPSPESYNSSAAVYEPAQYRGPQGASSNTQLPVQFMMAADELADDAKEDTTVRRDVSLEQARAELDLLVVPEDGSRLVALFLKYVFPALPIASHSQLGVTSSSPFPTPPSLSKIPTHLLAALYALALPFYSDDDHLCVSSAYKQPPVNTLWRLVFEEIFRDIHTPRLSVLQACLLYLQKPRVAAAADTPFRWSFMAFTVGLATSLGLHLECQDWALPPWEKRLRKRLWWVVYSEEKWRSLLQGQPTLISRDQWNVNDLADGDFLVEGPTVDESSSRTTAGLNSETVVDSGLHFRNLATLAQIADDVYQSFYTLRATQTLSRDFPLSLSTAQPLRSRLTAWYASLPPQLSSKLHRGTQLAPAITNSNASLHLAYLTLEVLVYRALLRPLQHSSIFTPSSTSPSPSAGDQDLHAAASATFTAATHCARLATTFVNDLSARDFAGFFPSYSRISFATMSNFVMLLVVQAPSAEAAREAKSVADIWRSTLRAQSRGFEGMKMGLIRQDAIYWRGLDRSWRVEDHVRVVISDAALTSKGAL